MKNPLENVEEEVKENVEEVIKEEKKVKKIKLHSNSKLVEIYFSTLEKKYEEELKEIAELLDEVIKRGKTKINYKLENKRPLANYLQEKMGFIVDFQQNTIRLNLK